MENNSVLRLLAVFMATLAGVSYTGKKDPVPVKEVAPQNVQNNSFHQPPDGLAIKKSPSYAELLDMSRKYNRKVFLFITSKDCTYCDNMKKDTLMDPEVRLALSGYIKAEFDKDSRDGSYLIDKLGVTRVPYYFIFNSSKIEKHEVGYRSVDDFLDWLYSTKVKTVTQTIPNTIATPTVQTAIPVMQMPMMMGGVAQQAMPSYQIPSRITDGLPFGTWNVGGPVSFGGGGSMPYGGGATMSFGGGGSMPFGGSFGGGSFFGGGGGGGCCSR